MVQFGSYREPVKIGYSAHLRNRLAQLAQQNPYGHSPIILAVALDAGPAEERRWLRAAGVPLGSSRLGEWFAPARAVRKVQDEMNSWRKVVPLKRPK